MEAVVSHSGGHDREVGTRVLFAHVVHLHNHVEVCPVDGLGVLNGQLQLALTTVLLGNPPAGLLENLTLFL